MFTDRTPSVLVFVLSQAIMDLRQSYGQYKPALDS